MGRSRSFFRDAGMRRALYAVLIVFGWAACESLHVFLAKKRGEVDVHLFDKFRVATKILVTI